MKHSCYHLNNIGLCDRCFQERVLDALQAIQVGEKDEQKENASVLQPPEQRQHMREGDRPGSNTSVGTLPLASQGNDVQVVPTVRQAPQTEEVTSKVSSAPLTEKYLREYPEPEYDWRHRFARLAEEYTERLWPEIPLKAKLKEQLAILESHKPWVGIDSKTYYRAQWDALHWVYEELCGEDAYRSATTQTVFQAAEAYFEAELQSAKRCCTSCVDKWINHQAHIKKAFESGAAYVAPTGLQEADMSGFVSTRGKAIDLKGDVKCVTTTPLAAPAATQEGPLPGFSGHSDSCGSAACDGRCKRDEPLPGEVIDEKLHAAIKKAFNAGRRDGLNDAVTFLETIYPDYPNLPFEHWKLSVRRQIGNALSKWKPAEVTRPATQEHTEGWCIICGSAPCKVTSKRTQDE